MAKTPENNQESSTAERLYSVFSDLHETVTDENGYGGPVCHEAEVDGWQLRIGNSDVGDLLVSMRKTVDGVQQFHTFEYGPDEEWRPLTIDSTESDLDELTDLAEQADWQDQINRAPRLKPR